MKKEEIKYDPIRNTFLKGLTYISENPNSVLKVSIITLGLLLLFIFYNNNNANKNLSYNKFASIATNKYLDNDKETSIDNFNQILNDYNSSESYNQAYVYLFNYYLENNMIEEISSMIKDNKFTSSDENIVGSIDLMMGDYLVRIKDYDNAIIHYKDAIKSFTIHDRIVYVKIKLCFLYESLSMKNEFNKLVNTIDFESINDFQLKSLYEQIKSWKYILIE